MDEQMIRTIVEQVLHQFSAVSPAYDYGKIPIAISARHVHLNQSDVELLFGKGYQLTEKKSLSQPGQYACHEQVMVVGPKGVLQNVRVLGPSRNLTQVEVSATDARALGIQVPLRLSGNIDGSAPVTLIGPKGSLVLTTGLIIAAAHIHMSPAEAQQFHVQDGEAVNIEVCSDRPIIFSNVKIRVNERFRLEMHIDTDEGNAAMLGSFGEGILHKVNMTPQKAAMPNIPQQAVTHSTKIIIITKRLLSEVDVQKLKDVQELHISKQTIVTALAYETAKRKGIKILRQA